MGYSVVKEGAALVCSLGTSQSILQVPEFHGVSTQGGNQANIADSIGGVHILSFCRCKRSIPPVACFPETGMKWLKGQKDCILDGEPALLENCIIPCIHGGVIRIVKTGQRE